MNSIIVKIYPPFSNVARCREIEILFKEDQISFLDAIKKMIDLYPKMSEIFSDSLNGDNIYGSCFPVSQGKLLRLDDTLRPFDVVEVFGSLSGG